MITHLASPAELDGDALEIVGTAYRHLFRARRLARGARLRVVDGAGRARWGEVTDVSRDRARVALAEPAPANEPAYRLELVVAPPRGERAAWLVEKATELGVRAVRFLLTERTPPRASANAARLQRVAAAALVQCHRSRLPEITGPVPWSALEAVLEAAGGDRFVLDPGADAGAVLAPAATAGAVVVGPEGGLTDVESRQLTDLGCRPVTLGPRVLRIETAALAAAVELLLEGPC